MRKTLLTLFAAASGLLLCVGLASAHRRPGPDSDDSRPFSNDDFAGTYANSFHGAIVTSSSVVGALSGTGTLISDGDGDIVGGRETATDGTNVCSGTLAGSYNVKPDGTGTLVVEFTTDAGAPNVGSCPPSPVTHVSSIVLKSRRSVATSSTDAGLVVSGRLERMSKDSDTD